MQAVLLLVLVAFQPQAALDPEAAALVERLVEERDGLPLAEGRAGALLESLGHDLPREDDDRRRWLPTLVLRLSWSPGPRGASGRRELIVYLSWPLG